MKILILFIILITIGYELLMLSLVKFFPSIRENVLDLIKKVESDYFKNVITNAWFKDIFLIVIIILLYFL